MDVSRRRFLGTLGLASGAIGATALLSACTSSGSTTAKAASSGAKSGPISGNLSIYSNLTGSKKDAADAMYNAFKLANPGVTITLTEFGDIESAETKLLSAVSAGVVPDIVLNHYYAAPQFASHLVDLNTRLKGSSLKLADLDSRVVGSGLYKGRRISLPMFNTSRTLLYNTKHFEEVGLSASKPPADWEELRTWATKLTVRDGKKLVRAGFQIPVSATEGSDNLWAMFLWGAGGELVSANGKKAAFNNTAGRDALTYWHSLINDDKVFDIGFTGPGGGDAFEHQTASMTMGLNPTAFFSQQDGVPFGSLPFPGKSTNKPISMSDPFSMYMLSSSKNPDAAWKFIEFVSTYDEQVEFDSATFSIPALTKAQSDQKITGLAQLTPFVDDLKFAKPLPVIPAYAEFWAAIERHIDPALSNKVSIKQALKDAETECNSILSGQE